MSKPAESLTRELARVETRNLQFYEAFTHRDIEKMAEVWAHTPHSRCVHPGWELVVGWTHIRASWQEIFRTLASIDFVLEDVHVEVSGDVAWVNLVVIVDVTTDDGDTFSATVAATNIFEKQQGDWRMVLHHTSNFAEEDGETEEVEEPVFYLGGGQRPSEPN